MLLLLLSAAVLAAPVLSAQESAPRTPVQAGFCDLLAHPVDYDGKLIQVRGTIHLAFEDFTLHSGACEESLRGVWLEYGDDAHPTPYAPFNASGKPTGSTFRSDAQMVKFRDALGQRRQTRPDGTHCWDRECDFYVVEATITGEFSAVTRYVNTANGGKMPNGFGHLGCCHQLVIESVSDVELQATSVPRGNKFACPTERWQLSGDELKRFHEIGDQPCSTYEDCQERSRKSYAAIALHWSDPALEAGRGWVVSEDPGERWYSNDLLLGYWVVVEGDRSMAIRETCHAASAQR